MKDHVVVSILASAVGLLGALLIAVALLWIIIKSRRKLTHESQLVPVDIKRRRFTFSEVVEMTNNFQRVIGRGGFGTVYHGHLDGAPVAVKLCRGRGHHQIQELQTEVNYLTRFYHKNLINLVGYCGEPERLALVFEFMANGDLRKNLLESGSTNLTWECRLRIAIDMAKALDYIHDSCEQPIIHRDFNSSNILLSENFEAKLSGFALVVTLPVDHEDVSINIAGTLGYIDPEYFVTSKVTTKSDIFGFGVVLMEIITGKLAIQRNGEGSYDHLTNWVSSMFANGEIEDIVDPMLDGEFDVYSAEEALKIAMTCVSENSRNRPRIDQVIVKLKHCLQMERDRFNQEIV